jgi:hypothetical protein
MTSRQSQQWARLAVLAIVLIAVAIVILTISSQ